MLLRGNVEERVEEVKCSWYIEIEKPWGTGEIKGEGSQFLGRTGW